MVSRPPQVFISNVQSDRTWTDAFAHALEAEGVEIWYSHKSLRPGDLWQERIQHALRESRVLCLIVSTEALKSPWIYFELGAAMADKKIIVPVLVGDATAADLPSPVSIFQAVDEASPDAAAASVARLITGDHAVTP